MSSDNKPDEVREPESRKKKIKKEAVEWLKTIGIALVAALIINYLIIINSVVPSGSMEETIMAGSRMFGFRLSYIFSNPERGDIIIFRYPDDKRQIYVKRVIGLPGETLEIIQGVTYIDGEPLEEPYLKEEVKPEDLGPYEIPEDSYFVMGDNRNYSRDSRRWNNTYVSKKAIQGKALLCYWPFSRFGVLE
ncbi:MAG: signal peptidase I [Lachnospiraceae bacterium]